MLWIETFFRLKNSRLLSYPESGTLSDTQGVQTQEQAKSTLLSQEYPNFSVQQIVDTNLLSRFPDVDKITTSLMSLLNLKELH